MSKKYFLPPIVFLSMIFVSDYSTFLWLLTEFVLLFVGLPFILIVIAKQIDSYVVTKTYCTLRKEAR